MFHKSRMASEMKSQTWLEIRRSSIQNALCSRWWWWKKKYLISSSSCWITTPGARSVISLMVMATGERERERAPVASSFLETWRPADDHRPFELASVSRDDADGISSNADWSEQLSFFCSLSFFDRPIETVAVLGLIWIERTPRTGLDVEQARWLANARFSTPRVHHEENEYLVFLVRFSSPLLTSSNETRNVTDGSTAIGCTKGNRFWLISFSSGK